MANHASGYARISRPDNQGQPRSQSELPRPTAEQVAWAAGLVEGEGTMHMTHSGKWSGPRIEVMMNDLDVLERLKSIYAGTIMGPYFYSHQTHPSWRWGLYRKAHVVAALTAMLPWFGERRAAKAKELLDACS